MKNLYYSLISGAAKTVENENQAECSMGDLRSALLAASHDGTLLSTVNQLNNGNSSSALVHAIVALHNEGQIDIVAAFACLKNDHSSNIDFFLIRHVLEKALPLLDAPTKSVIECVHHLVKEAGRDLTANLMIAPFKDFCSAAPHRPREALSLVLDSSNQLTDMLTPVIVAGARGDLEQYLDKAIHLAGHEDISIRTRAVFSLGRIDFSEYSSLSEKAVECLEQVVEQESDDQLLGNLITSAFNLMQNYQSHTDRVNAIITRALPKGQDCALQVAAELLAFNCEDLSDNMLDVLLSNLSRINYDNKGAIDNLDHGLVCLMRKGRSTECICFLESLLLSDAERFSLALFEEVIAEVLRNNNALLMRLVTRWFLRGDRVLCEGIREIVSSNYDGGLRLSVESSELKGKSPLHMLFIARKAIGYLFVQPIAAASLVISLIEHVDDNDTASQMSDLLFDPLLLNYPLSVGDFLTQLSDDESKKGSIPAKLAIKSNDEYIEMLKSVGDIRELHPTQLQQEAYLRHYSQIMTESMKAAEKQSVLLSLVTKYEILYGRRSISYTSDLGGESKRVEIPLHSHRTEFEIPRLEHIDPFDLDYMLRIFRAEHLEA